jgi:hypothetical protein
MCGHVARIEGRRILYQLLVVKPEGMRLTGRHSTSRKHNIIMYRKERCGRSHVARVGPSDGLL